jgi:hypothetical protein
VNDFGAFVALMLIAAALVGLGASNGSTCGYKEGKRAGRCIELCRPEKFIERVNDGAECLCATKRVRLAP